jgi:hypothetical protein
MTTMTISQGIRYAAKLKKKISDARDRALSSITHKSVQETAFKFDDMFDLSSSLISQLSKLQGKLSEANSFNTVQYKNDTISLSHAIKILQEIKGQIAWVKSLPSLQTYVVKTVEREWNSKEEEYVNIPVEMICHLPEANKADVVDELQEQFDMLNSAVETVNQTATFEF